MDVFFENHALERDLVVATIAAIAEVEVHLVVSIGDGYLHVPVVGLAIVSGIPADAPEEDCVCRLEPESLDARDGRNAPHGDLVEAAYGVGTDAEGVASRIAYPEVAVTIDVARPSHIDSQGSVKGSPRDYECAAHVVGAGFLSRGGDGLDAIG